jgi:hypothetical protein
MSTNTTVEDCCSGAEGCDNTNTKVSFSLGRDQNGKSEYLDRDYNNDNNENRPRLVSFHEPLTTSIYPVPFRSPDEIAQLFYSRQDLAALQAKEQQRYDKMMMKRIQQLVQNAMKDELEAAYARNASQEDIDAMMPQTTEEIFSLLGGMSALDMPKPPSALRAAEPTYLSTSTTLTMETERKGTSSDIDPGEEHQQQVNTKEEDEEKCSPEEEAPFNQMDDDVLDAIKLSLHGKEKKNTEEHGGKPDEKSKRQKRERLLRPDPWLVEATDTELDDLLEVPSCIINGERGNQYYDGSNNEQQHQLGGGPGKWADATDDELYFMFGLPSYDEASTATVRQKGDNDIAEGSIKDDLKDVVHQIFHLGNDIPSEVPC